MTCRLVVRPRAIIDVAEIFDYFLAVDPRLAMRFYDAYDATLPLIQNMPMAGGRLLLEDLADTELRYCRPKGFESYLIFYRLSGQEVEIVRVLHGSRNITDVLQDS